MPVKPWYGVHRWGFLWYGMKKVSDECHEDAVGSAAV